MPPLMPLIFGHRGSSVLAPENTREAFELALRLGADVLETDVRLSGDGVVFVTHDAGLERTTNGRGRVCDHGAAQLDALDAGYHFVDRDGRAHRGTGVHLLRLDALLRAFPERRVNVDIKDDDPAAAQAVASTIAACAAEERLTVGSFHARPLRVFRQLAPTVATAATRGEVARLYFSRHLRGRPATREPFEWLQIPPAWNGLPLATRAFIRSTQARGLRIAYWTINEPAAMRRLIERGADALVTDRPDLARDVVRAWREDEANERTR